jgi:FkbM family methyltransferase
VGEEKRKLFHASKAKTPVFPGVLALLAWNIRRSKYMALQTMTIDGITFSFVNEKEFAAIYDEVFKAQQYKFSAATASPFILDCGTNIGVSALYFKKLYPQAKIVAFEPNPDTFKLLELNIRQNNVSDIQLVNAALTDDTGEIDFYVSKDDTSPRKAYDTCIKEKWCSCSPDEWQTIKVPTVTLSSYINRQVDLLKLDIEAMEGCVLREIEDKLGLIEEIRMEYHGLRGNTANNLDNILTILQRSKFKFAFEHGPYIISLKRLRQKIETNKEYSVIIYTNRRRSSLWWQSWFVHTAIWVQYRVVAHLSRMARSRL